MKLILQFFRKYYLKYDEKHKILYIGKPILVKDFCILKNSLKKVKEEVLDIRLEDKTKYY